MVYWHAGGAAVIGLLAWGLVAGFALGSFKRTTKHPDKDFASATGPNGDLEEGSSAVDVGGSLVTPGTTM